MVISFHAVQKGKVEGKKLTEDKLAKHNISQVILTYTYTDAMLAAGILAIP
jgi:hypothetical protein